MFGICQMLFFVTLLSCQNDRELVCGYYIEKNDIGGEQKEIKVETKIGGLEKKLDITVPERKYSDEEIKIQSEKVKKYIYAHYLGKNKSSDKVCKNLYLMKKVKGKSSASAVDYGMEYLICGKENERDNLTGVINRIISMRMLINFAIISKDEVIKAKALATATAIAGITGIEPVIKGVQYAIIAILAFEESCIDTAALLDGKKIPLLKNTTDIKIKYEEICTVSGSFFREKARQYQESDGKITANFIDYREYLFAFLAVVPEEKIKSRLFDIIQHDLRTRYNESFRIHDCIVAADYNITYSMKFAFPFLWNMYGKDLKYKKFRRQVSVSHRYG